MPRRHIALAFPITAGHHQEVVRGIVEYAQRRGPWNFFTAPETYHLSVLDLKGWPGDGVIADVFTPAEARAAGQLGIPVVNLSGALASTALPRAMNDQRAIGRLAAEHLLRCEIRRFGYYGLKHIWYAVERREGFQKRLAEAGHCCEVLEADSQFGRQRDWPHWHEELRHWLKAMQPPFGVLAVHDNRARMLVDACRQSGLVVPHEVAVVGVDNDHFACEGSRPTLTSIARNGREIGYRAAQLLEHLLSTENPPKREVIVAPAGVVARESTDMVAVDNPDLSAAVRFIREHISRPFTVKELLKDLPVSRRWLEYRFRERFGCSPHEYICEARLDRARQLLLDPGKRTLEQVAEACGLSGARNLRLAFRRATRMTPLEYRRSHQTGGPATARFPG